MVRFDRSVFPAIEIQASLLADSFSVRGVDIAEYRVLVHPQSKSYRLEITLGLNYISTLECPLVEEFDMGAGFRMVHLTEREGESIVAVPRCFVKQAAECSSLPIAVRNQSPTGSRLPRRFKSAVDLLALYCWATGTVSGTVIARGGNWSHYVPETFDGWETTVPYVDFIIDTLARLISHESICSIGPGVVFTGDTDEATMGELVDSAKYYKDFNIPVTFLARRKGHVAESVLDAGAGVVDYGIHPFANDSDFSTFKRSVRTLSSRVRSVKGSAPVACRHHRFQWFDPLAVRRLLTSEGIRCELNLVAASGHCWIGAPTGLSHAIVDGPVMLLPTIVEDEVFLYDVNYSFKHANSSMSKSPTAFVLRFLDYWVLQQGLPACVNLHPEHLVSGYRHLQDAIFQWVRNNHVPVLQLETLATTMVCAAGKGL